MIDKLADFLKGFGTCIVLMIILAFAFFTSGCATSPREAHIQRILNASLPQSFEGDASVEHNNNYFNLSVELHFTGLKLVDGVWQWSGMTYDGKSPFTKTDIKLEPKPGSR